jgi:protein involved in polysaccharide export with SLBB domain
MPDIPMQGVLRSEAQSHITAALSKQLRDPQVQVQTNIRLTISGSVSRPGFYQVPADIMPTDAIMVLAGGFGGTADPNRTVIRRQGREIWSPEAFQDALLRGMTLDQLNLRTNDEIVVQTKSQTSWQTIVGVLGAASSITWIFIRVLR